MRQTYYCIKVNYFRLNYFGIYELTENLIVDTFCLVDINEQSFVS